jgi:hypothetical protein
MQFVKAATTLARGVLNIAFQWKYPVILIIIFSATKNVTPVGYVLQLALKMQ